MPNARSKPKRWCATRWKPAAKPIVLCPTNSRRDDRTPMQRHHDLVHALTQLQPLLADHGLIGLVGAADRLGNAAQLHKLLAAGYSGYASFEPFADEIAAADDIEQRLACSMAYLRDAVARVN